MRPRKFGRKKSKGESETTFPSCCCFHLPVARSIRDKTIYKVHDNQTCKKRAMNHLCKICTLRKKCPLENVSLELPTGITHSTTTTTTGTKRVCRWPASTLTLRWKVVGGKRKNKVKIERRVHICIYLSLCKRWGESEAHNKKTREIRFGLNCGGFGPKVNICGFRAKMFTFILTMGGGSM
jgi:hypothetical protein